MPRPFFVLLLLSVFLMHCAPDTTAPADPVAPGVPQALAEHRAARVSDVAYALRLTIPADSTAPVTGRVTIGFDLADTDRPLALDFAGPADAETTVANAHGPVQADIRDEHIVLPPEALSEGRNTVEIAFRAGDDALNRRDGYLYTLFVPDRARTAFPAFDQPDLKARFTLELDLPAGWTAVANAPAADIDSTAGRAHYRFAETRPISTYLFAFAAGRFDTIEAERDGRVVRIVHRETDPNRLARNVDEIFILHHHALGWLADYTGQPYPFEKFDVVLLPDFQFGGMEHPGAVFYRADRLLLAPSPTEAERLGRASLIAHETAHQWFGDLVTMRWFDDVWTKEVFANFMAAKIVRPSFPEVDHELRFFLAHHPDAYAVDRSAGTHPIRQPLENLNDAGSLYGAIIYQKAPIVMRQLELLLGEAALRDGLRTYLERYAFGNASWPDLIEILDAETDRDLAAWSRRWIDEPGRPTILASRLTTPDSTLPGVRFEQIDPLGQGRTWNQALDVVLAYPGDTRSALFRLDAAAETLDVEDGFPPPLYILPAGRGLGYGRFALDPASRTYLLDHLPEVSEPALRASAWLTLWDALLEGEIAPERLLETGRAVLATEPVEQNVERFTRDLGALYWRHLEPAARIHQADSLEALLWERMSDATEPSLKKTFFEAYRSVALTDEGIEALHDIWRGELDVRGLTFSEEDEIRLALELAVRGHAEAEDILAAQAERIENPERRMRFAFVRPAVSADPAVRDSLFDRLRRSAERVREPWVLEAMGYLHHPLRADARLIRPALELLPELKRTGTIFFPRRWLDAVLGGHRSPEAAAAVRAYLDTHPDLPPRLRGKVLQAADELFRVTSGRRSVGDAGSSPA